MWKAHSRAIRIAGKECTLNFSMRTWRAFELDNGVGLGEAVRPRYLARLLAAMTNGSLTVAQIGALALPESRRLVETASEVLRANVAAAKPDKGEAVASERDLKKPLDWLDLTAMAWFDLRLANDQFEEMSPAFFYALVKRFDESIERFFMASSVVCSTLVNIHADPEKHEPMSPLVFSPTVLGNQARAELERDKKKAIRAKILGLANIIPGAVVGEGGLAALKAAQKG